MVADLKVIQAIHGKPYRVEVLPKDRKRLECMFLRACEGGANIEGLEYLIRESGEVKVDLIQAFRLTMENRFFADGRMVDNNFLTKRSSGETEHRVWLTERGMAYLQTLENELAG
jgi:hypothetical protein